MESILQKSGEDYLLYTHIIIVQSYCTRTLQVRSPGYGLARRGIEKRITLSNVFCISSCILIGMLEIWDRRLDEKCLVFPLVRLVGLLAFVGQVRLYFGQSSMFVATFLDVVVGLLQLGLQVLVACGQELGMLNGVARSLLLLVRMT